MTMKRTMPALGLPYRRSGDTDIRSTFSMVEIARLAVLVPPLRACDLCMHSAKINDQLHCKHPHVHKVFGLQPVKVIRATGDACGPEAHHMDMTEWSLA